MTIEILKSPKKIQEIGTVYPWQNRNFYPSFRWTLCSPFWKSLTQYLTSHWQAGCTTDFLADTPPPPPPSRDLYFCEYYALPSRIFRGLFTRVVQVRLPDCFWWGSSLDCKTVRICAYSIRASSQTKGLERGWKQRAHALQACEARALRARRTLTACFTDFFTDFERKTDSFAV